MTTAIVVVSYHGRAALPGCLASCQDHAPDLPVILVDNGSDDGTADLAAELMPDATVIRLDENVGFAAGNNIGIAEAARIGAEYVFLINQDVHLRPACAAQLQTFLATHPRAAAVQAGVMLQDGRVNTIGNPFNYLGFAYAGGNGLTAAEARRQCAWLQSPGAWERGAEVPSASGAALMLRVAALLEAGMLEEELFLYHEDFELCLRLRSQGWTVHVLPAAQVVHDYHFSRNRAKFYYLERNRHWVWFAHLKLRTLVLLLPATLAAEIAVWAQALTGGWARQKLSSYTYWLDPSKRAYLRRRRRELRKARRLTDRELLAPAVGRLESPDIGGRLLDNVVNPASDRVWNRLHALIQW